MPFAFVPCLVCLCLCVCTRVRVLADSLERLWLLMAACSLRRLPFSLVHFSPLSLPFSLLLPLCPPDLPLARHHLCNLCSQGLCIPSPPPPATLPWLPSNAYHASVCGAGWKPLSPHSLGPGLWGSPEGPADCVKEGTNRAQEAWGGRGVILTQRADGVGQGRGSDASRESEPDSGSRVPLQGVQGPSRVLEIVQPERR